MKKTFGEKYEIIKKLKPMDDIFFEKLVEDAAVCQEILQTILGEPELKVVRVIPQNSIRNLQGRSVRLDTLCEREDNSFCNIEVQKSDDDDHVRRVRYQASCITANITETGVKFEKVPNLCMIYISRFDMFGAGKTMYHVGPYVNETGEIIENGLHEIYVNTQINDGSDVARLMECMEQGEINNAEFPNLSRRVRELKGEGGTENMCEELENYVNKRKKETALEIATRMLKNGKLTIEEIVDCVPLLSVYEVDALKQELALV